MSLPHLLLVDDSEALLAFEKAALSGHYAISTATNGREALAKIPQLRPAAILLDLSMPEMDGDEVLHRLQDDPEMRRIPVIIISSEKQRAESCIQAGAKAFLAKPIRAPELLPLVGRVLEEARREARAGNLAALFVSVGPLEIGLPLDCVVSVHAQPGTRPLPVGPSYLCEMLELHGEPICVLDAARRFGVAHRQRVDERKIVVVADSELKLAVCVDDVRDPEELPRGDLTLREDLGGGDHGSLSAALVAIARTQRGALPIIDPRALVSRRLLRELSERIRPRAQAGAA